MKSLKTEIWVDGSFDGEMPSWAILVKQDGVQIYSASIVMEDPKLKRYAQVAGELMAARKAIEWCAQNDVKEVTIYYDYEGVRSWATGSWKANNPVTREYAAFVQLAIKTYIDVTWVKVKAHSGDIDNNKVDKLARINTAVSVKEIEKGIILTYKTNSYKINFEDMTIEAGNNL